MEKESVKGGASEDAPADRGTSSQGAKGKEREQIYSRVEERLLNERVLTKGELERNRSDIREQVDYAIDVVYPAEKKRRNLDRVMGSDQAKRTRLKDPAGAEQANAEQDGEEQPMYGISREDLSEFLRCEEICSLDMPIGRQPGSQIGGTVMMPSGSSASRTANTAVVVGGATVGGIFAGPAGMLVGAAIGTALDFAVDQVKHWWSRKKEEEFRQEFTEIQQKASASGRSHGSKKERD